MINSYIYICYRNNKLNEICTTFCTGPSLLSKDGEFRSCISNYENIKYINKYT